MLVNTRELERGGENNQTAIFLIHATPSLSGILSALTAFYNTKSLFLSCTLC
jgi:hypothetical protein